MPSSSWASACSRNRFGQAAGSVSSRFSLGYRYSGAALTSDLSWLIGAGFAPLVALTLLSKFGLPFVGLLLRRVSAPGSALGQRAPAGATQGRLIQSIDGQ